MLEVEIYVRSLREIGRILDETEQFSFVSVVGR
jgi:hypothetical protein